MKCSYLLLSLSSFHGHKCHFKRQSRARVRHARLWLDFSRVMKRPFKGRFLFRLSKQNSENKIVVWQQHSARKVSKVIKAPISHLEVISAPQQESQPTALSQLKYAQPAELYLRDGEVVIHRRPESPLWHCRFKLQDGSWHRQSTRQASIEHAVRMACDLYDETRFRQRLGLAQKSPRIAVPLLASPVRNERLPLWLLAPSKPTARYR